MLKKTITFDDFEGKPHTRDFYFAIKHDKLVELEMVHPGGFKEHLQAIVSSNNGRIIMDTFKEIIAMSYGEKSEDGLSFLQSKERSEWFMGTHAYSELFYDIVTNAKGASDFINAIMPSDIEAQAAKLEARMKQSGMNLDTTQDAATANLPTPAQIGSMSKEDMEAMFQAIREGKIAPPMAPANG